MRIASSHLVAGLMMGLLIVGSAMADQTRSQVPSGPGADSRVSNGVVGISFVIGAERIGDPALLYVGMVHPEGPAYKAGLRHGDEITSVDGTSLKGKTYQQVVTMIRGETGTVVKMEVKDEKGIHQLSVERVAGDKLKHPAETHGRPE